MCELRNQRDASKLIDLVWLWFRSRMIRCQENDADFRTATLGQNLRSDIFARGTAAFEGKENETHRNCYRVAFRGHSSSRRRQLPNAGRRQELAWRGADELRQEVLQRSSGRAEIARRRADELHQEVPVRRDRQLTVFIERRIGARHAHTSSDYLRRRAARRHRLGSKLGASAIQQRMQREV